MEQIYALGVSCIEPVQVWFYEWEDYIEVVNIASNPNFMLEVIFPLLSMVDSVFASQLLLCISFGGWLSGLMQWCLFEARPYWWVHETTFYANSQRPVLLQTIQTCEGGPGSPSGHSITAASVVMLVMVWYSHVCNDRKWLWRCGSVMMYIFSSLVLVSVMIARMFIAAHFPHQCLFGSLLGLFISPALCIFVMEPFIWQCGRHSTVPVRKVVAWHVMFAVLATLSTLGTYYVLTLSGINPHATGKVASRWCASRNIQNESPMYTLVNCTANLTGWALCVTPGVAKFRHYTKNRSLFISIHGILLVTYIQRQIRDSVACASDEYILAMLFLVNVIKPALMLRLVPAVSMWPFSSKEKPKIK